MNKETNKREEKITVFIDKDLDAKTLEWIKDDPKRYSVLLDLQTLIRGLVQEAKALPQNGDREKEWKCPCSCHDGSGVHFREECPCNQPDSPSEGKEKEPKHIHEPFLTKWYQGKQYCPSCPSILTITNNADTPSALAEKETAPKTKENE